MSKVPTDKINEYVEFLKIVEKRLKSHKQILTINKSIILKLLFENNEHLSVEDIIRLSKKKQNNSLKVTTVYRALSSFEALGVVDSIIVDDKKRYELSYLKKPHYHLICQNCHSISEFESLDIHDKFLENLKNLDFIPTNFNVIINGVCEKCQN